MRRRQCLYWSIGAIQHLSFLSHQFNASDLVACWQQQPHCQQKRTPLLSAPGWWLPQFAGGPWMSSYWPRVSLQLHPLPMACWQTLHSEWRGRQWLLLGEVAVFTSYEGGNVTLSSFLLLLTVRYDICQSFRLLTHLCLPSISAQSSIWLPIHSRPLMVSFVYNHALPRSEDSKLVLFVPILVTHLNPSLLVNPTPGEVLHSKL